MDYVRLVVDQHNDTCVYHKWQYVTLSLLMTPWYMVPIYQTSVHSFNTYLLWLGLPLWSGDEVQTESRTA